jgi:hypothetical protein
MKRKIAISVTVETQLSNYDLSDIEMKIRKFTKALCEEKNSQMELISSNFQEEALNYGATTLSEDKYRGS